MKDLEFTFTQKRSRFDEGWDHPEAMAQSTDRYGNLYNCCNDDCNTDSCGCDRDQDCDCYQDCDCSNECDYEPDCNCDCNCDRNCNCDRDCDRDCDCDCDYDCQDDDGDLDCGEYPDWGHGCDHGHRPCPPDPDCTDDQDDQGCSHDRHGDLVCTVFEKTCICDESKGPSHLNEEHGWHKSCTTTIRVVKKYRR